MTHASPLWAVSGVAYSKHSQSSSLTCLERQFHAATQSYAAVEREHGSPKGNAAIADARAALMMQELQRRHDEVLPAALLRPQEPSEVGLNFVI